MNRENDADRFADLITALCGAFGRKADDATAKGYWIGLEDLSIEAVEVAIASAMRTCEHMPRPVELRRLAGERPAEALASEAWESVVKAVGIVGRYRSVDFEDKAINASIRSMGGWVRLCERGGDDFHTWARKEFLAAYGEYASRPPATDAMEHLPGVHERDPSAVAEEPKRIPGSNVVPLRLVGGG